METETKSDQDGDSKDKKDDDEDMSLDTSFKVTEALEVMTPGASGPELLSGTPTFIWADDSSEDRYEVVLFDARGELVWARDDVPKVTGSADVEVAYEGPDLIEGMYYQFRAVSVKDGQQGATRISATEDLRGVFVYSSAG